MRNIRFVIIALLIAASRLCAWYSFEVLGDTNSVKVVKEVKILYDTNGLSTDDIYKAFLAGKFQSFPKEYAGFDNGKPIYWIAFEIKNASDENLFLELANLAIPSADLFAYQNDILMRSIHNGSKVKKEDRPVNSFHIRFPLLPEDLSTVYLMRIETKELLSLSMQIGSQQQLDKDNHMMEELLFAVFLGCLFGVLAHNLILFASTKDKAYLFYSVYLFFFLIFMTIVNEYITLVLEESFISSEVMKPLSIQVFHIALILFTVHSLDIAKLSLRLYRIIYPLCIVIFILFLSIHVGGSWAFIGYATSVLSLLFCLFLAIFALIKGSTRAKIYLLAFSPYFMSLWVFCAFLFGLLPFSLYVMCGLYFGAMWQMILLSFMQAHRVASLEAQRKKLLAIHEVDARLLYLNSRYSSIGQVIGNIAHQWKQPLNAIGAIHTSIKATLIYQGAIAKDKLLEAIDESFAILKYLSDTMDTFYGFLTQNNNLHSSFEMAKELESIRKILRYSFQNCNISLIYDIRTDLTIQGNANEFSHAIINLILNAKEAFEGVQIESPTIILSATETDTTCVITVSDNAGGILLKPIDSAFELNVSTKENGSGLGLYMAKNIIENRFGGSIKVENLDGGAVFTILIPNCQAYRESLEAGQLTTPKSQELNGLLSQMEKKPDKVSQEEAKKLIHELRVHQVELEMQNEELRRTQIELDATRERYFELYDLAPMGYCTLSATGQIIQANLTATALLGMVGDRLVGEPITRFIAYDDQDIFYLHSKRCAGSQKPHSCQLQMVRNDGTKFLAHMANTTITDENGTQKILLAISDISNIKAN
jgi:two-component system, sensor histidine kinase LadS